MNERKLFWSPAVTWEAKDGVLKAAAFTIRTSFARLFPQFYFICAAGATEQEILAGFPAEEPDLLLRFIRKLRSALILVSGIQSPDEIFYAQKKLFQSETQYETGYFMDATHVGEFREKAYARQSRTGDIAVKLPQTEVSELFAQRRSTRKFDGSRIPFSDFAALMNLMMRKPDGSFYYGSAGALYPIDCYVSVYHDRVENVANGLYLLDPMRGGLIPADSGASLEQDLHFAGNRNIYSGSAFSLYFVYNAEYSMPKYGSRSYYYAMLDEGILIGTLNLAAAEHGMGCCSIGDLNFRKAEAAFHLNEYQQYLHCMIFGKPAAEK